jgi:putative membrane protein
MAHRRTPGAASLFLAAERTFLAQVRTGVAVMAFGFVVARFALFLRGLGHVRTPPPAGLDVMAGALLTGLGGLAVLTAALRLRRRRRQIAAGRLTPTSRSDLALALALTVAGLGLAVYLGTQALWA